MNLGELFKTKRWKTFMGFVYGWGAAVVMVGALFKLEHWKGSSELLTVGLLTEAFIFFLSAFEPPANIPEWEKVYPELGEDYELEEMRELKSSKGGGLETLFGSSELTPELMDRVGKGLTELSNTARGISDISSATLATDMYVKNLGSASESMNSFAEINNKANESIDKSVGTLISSYSQAATQLSETGKNLSAVYQKSSDVISGELENIGSSSKQYSGNLERLNKNLDTLNSSFENQLKDTQDQFKANQKFNQDLAQMNTILTSSVDELKKYKENAEMLNKNLEALNTIYGNMLGAMSYKK
ncbi:gliding motility protein GldL [Draconibacterium sp. IB214405]|uniref:type IX secretion system motor protein PorL/GldL n=1 Tax=Draconibacterium sp. IB214405 TaxID=3097352 RepID=UPI002A0EE53C|nr:gliding motility protein GldL [Draconibacterium sp. IB214405]MDX8337681.1 gliding motility protein GldL [Draconibacterium sp. IB214405]